MNEINQIAELITEPRFANLGWIAITKPGTVALIRGGYARVMVNWIGGEKFVITWEYDTNDWRALQVERTEVVLETDMTLNAYAFAQ